MVDEFVDYTQKVDATNEEVAFNGGVIWHSSRHHGPDGEHDAPLPPGLHISCGIANTWAHSENCGGFEAKGACMNILHVPKSGTMFKTRIDSGPTRAFGFYLPDESMQTHDPVLSAIVEAAANKPMINFGGHLVRKVPRLTSILGVQYQGSVRAALFQARVLELTALIAAEIEAPGSPTPSQSAHRSADRTRNFIEANLHNPVRLDDIARATGVSIRTMTAAFRDVFDESIAEYVRRRKMEEAATILELGGSVSEAAYHVGYTPNALSKAFKAHFNKTPSQR